MDEPEKYVAEFLKQHDRDRYFSTLILKEPHRHAVQALYAFSAEVAAIPARVSEPGPGEIRLQWWKDALEGDGHGVVGKNPVAAALLKAIQDYNLPVGPLVRLIAARRFDLYQDPMPDMETFEGYAGETNSVLYQYAATILCDGSPLENGNAAGHLGVAHALVGHIRAFGHNAARGRIFLPWSAFAANGVSERQIFSGEETTGLFQAIGLLTETATEYLEKARTEIRDLSQKARPAFAMLPVLDAQLRHLERNRKTCLRAPNRPADWQKILHIMFWR